MSEVEKLRSLLAEALSGLSREQVLNEDTERWEWVHHGLAKRIKATLAEPVGECADCELSYRVHDEALTTAIRERDEARAEVQDAIDAILLRGGYNEAQRQGRSLIQLVGQLGHDLLNARGALNDYKHVHDRMTRERDEARAALEKEKAAHRLEREAHDRRFDRETKCMKERDEARAEVERLHDIERERNELLTDLTFYQSEALPQAKAAAYQRGAEAMREAAARQCETASPTHGRPTTVGSGYAAAIRALPTPEDKP